MKSLGRRTLSIQLLLFLLCLVAAIPAKAQESEFDEKVDGFVGNHVEMQNLLTRLQHAVAAHDAASVAEMVNYPITVSPYDKTITIRTRADFIAKYDSIMTPGIVQAIEKQKYEDLFVRDQGAMIGRGQVWFSGVCLDKTCTRSVIRIKTIQSFAETKK